MGQRVADFLLRAFVVLGDGETERILVKLPRGGLVVAVKPFTVSIFA